MKTVNKEILRDTILSVEGNPVAAEALAQDLAGTLNRTAAMVETYEDREYREG